MVDAGSEPTHEEKMRVPGSPLGTLLQILILPVTPNIAKKTSASCNLSACKVGRCYIQMHLKENILFYL